MILQKYISDFQYNFRLAFPIVLGLLGHTLVGIIDNIMVGRIGATELAAVSLGNSFVFVAMAFVLGFSTAITPLVAESDGAKSVEKGKDAFQQGLLLCTLIGVLLFAAIFFIRPLFYHMGQSKEVVDMALPYLNIVACSLIPLSMYQAYKQFADGKSETKYSMYATIIGNIVNVILNYLLIYGIWIFPELGIIGAGIGTIVSRIVMVVYMHLAMQNKAVFKAYFDHFFVIKIKKVVMNNLIRLGGPSSLQIFFEVALFTGAVWLSGALGTEVQAANQIALSMASFTFMFASGLGSVGMIRVGNQKGLKDFIRLKEVAISVIIMVVILQTIFGFGFVVLHDYLPTLFIDSNLSETNLNVVSIAAQLLLIAAFFQIVDGVQVAVLGVLRGLQDVKLPMYITFFSYWVIGFPISVYLGLFTEYAARGIWIGLFAGLTVAAVLLYLRFNYLTKKLILENH